MRVVRLAGAKAIQVFSLLVRVTKSFYGFAQRALPAAALT